MYLLQCFVSFSECVCLRLSLCCLVDGVRDVCLCAVQCSAVPWLPTSLTHSLSLTHSRLPLGQRQLGSLHFVLSRSALSSVCPVPCVYVCRVGEKGEVCRCIDLPLCVCFEPTFFLATARGQHSKTSVPTTVFVNNVRCGPTIVSMYMNTKTTRGFGGKKGANSQ